MKKILLLGNTGKMGIALNKIFKNEYKLVGKNSADYNASNFDEVKKLIVSEDPDIVINTVAIMGIDYCELNPEKAFRINALYPRYLSSLSKHRGFTLIHFSSEAVFSDSNNSYLYEDDPVEPINVYGMTKYAGDCFVAANSDNYYICRLPIIFGESIKKNQFVEKMLTLIDEGNTMLKISNDIISSPSYSIDIAKTVKALIEDEYNSGVYHVSNNAMGSLYDLITEILKNLQIDVKIEPTTYKDFEHIGNKNTCTPLSSIKIDALRDWRLAVHEYCKTIQNKAI